MEIKDKVIVITGAAQGLGKNFALDLANRGAKLALADINQELLEEVRKTCEQAGTEARASDQQCRHHPRRIDCPKQGRRNQKNVPGQLAGCDRCQSHRVLPLRQGIFRETPGTEKAGGLYQHFFTFPFWQYGSEQLYRDQGRSC